MSAQLQARGKGLPPVNTDCTTDSLASFLEREGYTDVRVVSTPPERKAVDSGSTRPAARRTAKRTVTRRPRG